MISIRRFEESDAASVSDLIRHTVDISNRKDYPPEVMEELIAIETPEHVLERAGWTHFYVAESASAIVGCGAIGPFWGKEEESSLFTIFVSPEHQGLGIGRKIIGTLEQDEYFLRASRIEIPASVTGVPFYQKMGYGFKNGISEPDEEHIIRMEKCRVSLVPTTDAETVWKMQVEGFASLLEKYGDHDTNPAAEPLSKVASRFEVPGSVYYFISYGGVHVGVIRVVTSSDVKRISPLWIMPEFRNKGYAQMAMLEAERIYGPTGWSLETILQEEGNIHLYEKMGYHRVGEPQVISDSMSLISFEK